MTNEGLSLLTFSPKITLEHTQKSSQCLFWTNRNANRALETAVKVASTQGCSTQAADGVAAKDDTGTSSSSHVDTGYGQETDLEQLDRPPRVLLTLTKANNLFPESGWHPLGCCHTKEWQPPPISPLYPIPGDNKQNLQTFTDQQQFSPKDESPKGNKCHKNEKVSEERVAGIMNSKCLQTHNMISSVKN